MVRKSLKDLMFKNQNEETGGLLIKDEHRDKFQELWPFYQFEGKDVLNVFRFLPTTYLEDDGSKVLSSYRLSDEPRDFGLWVYPVVLASVGGRQGVTFIMGSRETDDEISILDKPYYVLFKNARRILTNRAAPHWIKYNLLRGFCEDESRIPLLFKPEVHYLVFGLVLQHPLFAFTGKYHHLSEGPVSLIVLRRNLGERLFDLCDSPENLKPEFDPISLDAGKIALIFKSASPSYQGFDISLTDSFQGVKANLSKEKNLLVDRLAFWDILHFPSIQQQVEYICRSKLPPEVVDRCLGEQFGHMFPPDFVEKLDKSKKSPVKEVILEEDVFETEEEEIVAPPKVEPKTVIDEDLAKLLGLRK